MARSSNRTTTIRTDVVQRLRKERGLSVERLAQKVGVDVRTLKRWLAGGSTYLQNVESLSVVLGTTVVALLPQANDGHDAVPFGFLPEREFQLHVKVAGRLRSRSQLSRVVILTPSIIESLEREGISITSHNVDMTVDDKNVFVHHTPVGKVDHRRQWYVLLASSQRKRRAFDRDITSKKTIRLGDYGDILMTGYGARVPRSVAHLMNRVRTLSKPRQYRR